MKAGNKQPLFPKRDQRRDRNIIFRVSAAEHDFILWRSTAANMNVSDWFRDLLRKEMMAKL